MKIWELNEEAFLQLLARLNSDPELAGESYEKLRAGLIYFFERKGCLIPAELADETVNRMARKIEEGQEIGDIFRFSYGVAKYVLLEYWHDHRREWEQLTEQHQLTEHNGESEEERLECMKKCLQALSSEEQDLIVKNCTLDKKGKLELAITLGLTINALRLRVFRIRARLYECRENCIREL
jgi:DNA-directed RNA polymerase specialized sigma24 family protein